LICENIPKIVDSLRNCILRKSIKRNRIRSSPVYEVRPLSTFKGPCLARQRVTQATVPLREQNVSADLGRPIASGRTAEIYSWDQERVLKLYYDWVGLEDIQNEARSARAIHESGLPIPEVGELVRVNERNGLLYQRMDGNSMFTLGQRKPWNIPRYLRRAAELHVEIHSRTISADLPSQRQMLEKNIREAGSLPDYLRLKVLAALHDLPDGRQLCHGDFWPGNILVTPGGEMVIDWIRASYGNPLADVARSTNGILGFLKTRQNRRAFLSYGESRLGHIRDSLLRILANLTYPIYMNRYFQLRPSGKAEYQRWLPIVAAARLSDNIPELEKMLLEQVEGNL